MLESLTVQAGYIKLSELLAWSQLRTITPEACSQLKGTVPGSQSYAQIHLFYPTEANRQMLLAGTMQSTSRSYAWFLILGAFPIILINSRLLAWRMQSASRQTPRLCKRFFLFFLVYFLVSCVDFSYLPWHL